MIFNKFLKDTFLAFPDSLKLSKITIKLKYRRTILGDIWLVLLSLITVSLISIIWSQIFKISFLITFKKLFIGMSTFALLTAYINGSCNILYENYKNDILSLAIPLPRIFMQHFIKVFSEYLIMFPIFFFLYLITLKNFNLNFFLFIPGLFLVLMNCFFLMLILALICSRFRDISLLIKSLMASAMLFTPILWDKEMLGIYEVYVYLNPLTSFVEVIRDPFLEKNLSIVPYLILITILILNYFICSYLYNRKYKILTFWL